MSPSLAAVDGTLFHAVFCHVIPEIVDRTVHGHCACFCIIVAVVDGSPIFSAVLDAVSILVDKIGKGVVIYAISFACLSVIVTEIGRSASETAISIGGVCEVEQTVVDRASGHAQV